MNCFPNLFITPIITAYFFVLLCLITALSSRPICRSAPNSGLRVAPRSTQALPLCGKCFAPRKTLKGALTHRRGGAVLPPQKKCKLGKLSPHIIYKIGVIAGVCPRWRYIIFP